MNKCMLIFIALTLAAAGSCERTQDKISLRLRLQPGHTYTLRLLSEQEITETVHGTIRHTGKTIGMGLVFLVEDVRPAGDALVRITIHSATFRQEQEGKVIEYDSRRCAAADTPSAAMGIAAAVGESFRAILLPTGRVKQILGAEEMIGRIIEKLAIPPEVDKSLLVQEFRPQFGGEALREMIENLLAVHPEEPVDIGESWERFTMVSQGFPQALHTQWTLQSVSQGRVLIDVQSQGEPFAGDSSAPQSDLCYDMSGKQQGTLELDEASGWIVRGALRQQLSGRVMVKGTQGIGQSISWPISVESTTSFEPINHDVLTASRKVAD